MKIQQTTLWGAATVLLAGTWLGGMVAYRPSKFKAIPPEKAPIFSKMNTENTTTIKCDNIHPDYKRV